MSPISVREGIRPLIHSVKLPMVDVVLPENCEQTNSVLSEIVAKTFELLNEKRNTLTAVLEDETNMCYDWLSSVPYSLRHSCENIVNYLGMLVLIDFRHWAELPSSGKLANVGEVVEGFVNFYTRIDTENEKANGKFTAVTNSSSTENTDQQAKDNTPMPNLVRGSAAMVRLLYEAVERHGIHWYDPVYLQRFKSVEEAEAGLSVCFWGCMEDGTTPLLMPATRERIELILSIRDVFLQQQTSYYKILCESNGRLYTEDNTGFIQRLILLHDRYKDYATCEHVEWKESDQRHPPPKDHPSKIVVPIMKLAQLTALSLMEALPLYWRNYAHLHKSGVKERVTQPTTGSTPETCKCEWLDMVSLNYQRKELNAESEKEKENNDEKTNTLMPPLFIDEDELAMCCDYQIPKALHDAGILKYNEKLLSTLANAILLEPGGAEEVNIRIATLIGSEVLIEYLHRLIMSKYNNPTFVKMFKMRELDFVLWWVGRHPSNRARSRHHLCRTIMYEANAVIDF